MALLTDKQTLDDLNLLGRFKKDSIIGIFDRTQTRKGQTLLEAMFRNPLQSPEQINARRDVMRYFASLKLKFPVAAEAFALVESYLNGRSSRSLAGAAATVFEQKFNQLFAAGQAYDKTREGILAMLEILAPVKDFLRKLGAGGSPFEYRCGKLLETLCSASFEKAAGDAGLKKLKFRKALYYHCMFRFSHRAALDELLGLIYEADVYISVVAVSSERGFRHAEALPADKRLTAIQQLFHPAIPGAVANDVRIDAQNNVIFLTGANMAGKSTFMKAYAIAVYLAHMGFPVAAQSMRFSVVDGLFTSINVPDNIDLGYSHFYAEVLRVKKIAERVAEGMNLMVIFDELFKGTNVKDAFDATVAVTEALAEKHNCSFIVSTHITEAGEELRRRCENLQFLYLPTEMQGTRPTYPYKLREGITDDRHGMMIINNERVVETIMGETAGIENETL